MKNPATLAALAVLLSGPATGSVLAQQTIIGAEPNGTKAEATPALDMEDGDNIWNDWGSVGLNFFRVGTAPAPPGIYRHSLEHYDPCWATLYGSASTVDRVIPNSLQELQPVQLLDYTSDGGPTWYGFGRAEEVYVDLARHYNYRGPGGAVLRSTPVTPQDLGSLPLSTPTGTLVALSATLTGSPFEDTELHLFDELLRPIPGHWIDDPYEPDRQANMNVHLAPGRYYAACTADGISSAVPASSSVFEENSLFNAVTDDLGAVAANTRAAAGSVRFAAYSSSSNTTIQGTNVEVLPFELSWFTFLVGTPSGADEVVFCAGDGPSVPCPCGTPVATRLEGCPNSTGRGAEAIAWRRQYFSPVTRLTLRGLPPDMAALPFAGFGHSTSLPASGGRLCLDPGYVRLELMGADAHGTAEADLGLDAVPGVFSGQVLYLQAAYRDVLAPNGCQVNFTSGTGIRVL